MSFYTKAKEDLNQVQLLVHSGTPQDVMIRLIANLQAVYTEQEKQQKEINQEVEGLNSTMLGLSATSTTHTDMLTKHDAIIEHYRGVPGATKGQVGILESRAIGGLTNVGGDRFPFKTWNDRLINAMSQVRQGSRALFKKMTEVVDQGLDPSAWEHAIDTSQERDMMESRHPGNQIQRGPLRCIN